MPTAFPIPLTPATPDELFRKHRIVAVLCPSGSGAVEGFSDLVDQIVLAPCKHKSILDRQCIFLYRAEKRPLDDILDIGASLLFPNNDRHVEHDLHDAIDQQDDLDGASDTTCASASTINQPQLWHGFVGISLDHVPEHPRFGWSIGYQPVWLATCDPMAKSPNIPLCSEERGRLAGMHRRHVVVNFAHGTGTLACKALHERPRVRCDTSLVHEKSAFPLANWKHFIDFGRLQYWMVYVQVSTAIKPALRQATETFISSIPGGRPLIASASATPSADDKTVGKWKIVGVAGRGSSTTMAVALHSEAGTLAVVRHKQETDNEYDRFLEELQIEKSTTWKLAPYRFGSCHIQRFRECVYYPQSGEVFAFYEPLCAYDLITVLQTEDYSDLERQILFTQLMLAIRDLHAIGRVHGDVKTRNICVRSRAPLCIVLIDTASIRGCCDDDLKSTPGAGGTIGTLAPEQEAAPTYGRPVDVWAAGCVGVQLLLRQKDFTARYLQIRNRQGIACNPWRLSSSYRGVSPPNANDADEAKRKFHRFRATLGGHARSSKEHLLYRMLDPDPARRITASDVTGHDFVCAEYKRSSEASCTTRPGVKRRQAED